MSRSQPRLLALAIALVTAGVACSSSSSSGTPSDAGSSSSSSGGGRDSGSSSGSLVQDSGSSGSSSGGPACPSGVTCAGSCCSADAFCFADKAGNQSCVLKCTTSSDCTSAANPCCAPIPGVNGVQVCLPNNAISNQQCVCTKTTECASGCCAPTTNATGNPTLPFVCRPADGASYDCCSGGTTCTASTDCCVALTGTGAGAGSAVCETGCQQQSTCGSATCQPLTMGMCAGFQGSCVPN